MPSLGEARGRFDDYVSRRPIVEDGQDDAQLCANAESMDSDLREMVNDGVSDVEDSSEDGEDGKDDSVMSAGLRKELDAEIGRLAGSGLPDTEAEAAARSSEVVHPVPNCVHPLQSGAEGPQKSLRFECCMLQRSVTADGKTTWHDCRCDEQDDFDAFLNSSSDLSRVEEGDEVCLLPVDSSMVFHAPADFDVDAALKKEQMALLGNVESVKEQVKAKPPFSVLSVELRSGNATIKLNIQDSKRGVGTTI